MSEPRSIFDKIRRAVNHTPPGALITAEAKLAAALLWAKERWVFSGDTDKPPNNDYDRGFTAGYATAQHALKVIFADASQAAVQYRIPANSHVAHRVTAASDKPWASVVWRFKIACTNKWRFGTVVTVLPAGARRCPRCFREKKP